MPIWKKPIDLALLEAANRNTAVEHLGIEFVEVGDDFLRARVPVDHRTVQPFRLLHGGVSVVLAEGLERAGRDLTRAKLRNALAGIRSNDLGGLSIDYASGAPYVGSRFLDLGVMGANGKFVG